MLNQETIERFSKAVLRLFDEETRISGKEGLRRYYSGLEGPEGIAAYVRYSADLLRIGVASLEGAVVLDAGCGFGLMCILLAIMGAKEVHGIDIMEDRLSTFKECLDSLKDGGIELEIFPRLGSVMKTEYDANKFDLILSIESVSHYRDTEMFIRESHRILKPGGVLIISDSNNGANPKIVKGCKQLWERFEKGPTGSFHGHIIEEAYEDMRKGMIREAYPDWSEEEVVTCARVTFGLTRDEVLEACKRRQEDGILPDKTFEGTECPVNPRTGSLLERFHHPHQLAKTIEAFGFRTRLYSYFGGASGNPIIRLANDILMHLTAFTIKYARGYRIVAKKP